MAVEEYYDNLFKTAAGWLGWWPELILDTNINQISLALEGKIDFVKKTNPWGSGEEEKSDEERLREQTPNPELAMKQLLGAVAVRQRNDSRFKTKPKVK